MHPRRMEIGDLDYLTAIIRAGSIAAAARELGVSQPALSKRPGGSAPPASQAKGVVGRSSVGAAPGSVLCR